MIPTRRLVALVTAFALLLSALPLGPVRAGMIQMDQVLEAAPGVERAAVDTFLARDEVRDQLQRLGVDPLEASARLAALTDAEIHALAGRIEQLPAGQGVFETLIIAALFTFLVLLITDILGYTEVFPFVNHGKILRQ
jgi:hypothetical protein